jgi:hypothetical protein
MEQRRVDSIAKGPESQGTCSKLRELSKGRHFRLLADETCRLFVAQRTPLLFASTEELAGSFAEIESTFLRLQQVDCSLLLDLRAGPARNDPDFERTSEEHRRRVLALFAKRAALVATAVGLLQVQRYNKTDGSGLFVTNSEATAFEYLGLPSHEL